VPLRIQVSGEESLHLILQRELFAAAKDAHIKSSRKECASGMGQRIREESLHLILQRELFAAVKDAQIRLGREECVLGMGQRINTNYAR
jgi:hypothetical protein